MYGGFRGGRDFFLSVTRILTETVFRDPLPALGKSGFWQRKKFVVQKECSKKWIPSPVGSIRLCRTPGWGIEELSNRMKGSGGGPRAGRRYRLGKWASGDSRLCGGRMEGAGGGRPCMAPQWPIRWGGVGIGGWLRGLGRGLSYG